MAHNNRNKKEPDTAPPPDHWYNLTLGPSFKDNSSTKFCTLRYEFKPASIDKTQTGSLHKTKENKVTVEFQNNQLGKPKLSFEGSSEDYKDNDAVLFFDGETFRLERLHRAVKRLRHVRLPGESAAAGAGAAGNTMSTMSVGASSGGQGLIEPRSPIHGKGVKSQPFSKTAIHHSVPVEVERIDIGESKSSPGPKSTDKGVGDNSSAPPFTSTESLESKRTELDINVSMLFDGDSDGSPDKVDTAEQENNTGFDINIPNLNDMDDEIADVDVSDNEAGNGPNAAEALRAQVNAEGRGTPSSSSSGSSDSGSSGSGSGSGSSSSDSEASDDDSVNSI